MKKYRYSNNTVGRVLSVTRDSTYVNVSMTVDTGSLVATTSDIYPITFIHMSDELFTAFAEKASWNGNEWVLSFPVAQISQTKQNQFLVPNAVWELRLTATELNEAMTELAQITSSLVSTPVITGTTKPVINVAQTYTFKSTPSFAGATIAKYFLTITGVGVSETITPVNNVGTYTLTVPTTISAGTPLEMSVVALDTNGFRSAASIKALTAMLPYIDKPSVEAPLENAEVVGLNFTLTGSTFTPVGATDTLESVEWEIFDSQNVKVYTKTDTAITSTITNATLTMGATYKTHVRYKGTARGWSAWSNFRTFSVSVGFINAPQVIAPTTNTEVFRYNLVITGSAFTPSLGVTDTHIATDYKITNAAGTSTIWTQSDVTSTTAVTVADTLMTVGETYKVLIRYRGQNYGWSAWSTANTVTCKASYVNAPTILAPVANATISAQNVEVRLDAFSVTGGTDTPTALQCKFTSTDGAVVVDSGEVTGLSNYTVYTLVLGKLTGTVTGTVTARVKGTLLGWSSWSTATNVIVKQTRHGEILYDINNQPAAVITGSYASNGEEPWTIRGRKVWIAVALASKRGVDKTWNKSSSDTNYVDIPTIENPGTNWKLAANNTAADGTGLCVSSLSTEAHMDASLTYTQVVKTSKELTDAIRAYNASYMAAQFCRTVVLKDLGAMNLPSIDVLMRLYQARTIVDALDPTASANTAKKLSAWGFGSVGGTTVWSASESSSNFAWLVNSDGSVYGNTKTNRFGCVPTIEIPADEDTFVDLHGTRVAGGIAVGAAAGKPYTFADGKSGWLVVSPASQRKANIKWGLYSTDTTLPNYTSEGFTDTKTGAQNTDVLTSSTYSSVNDGQGSVGAPAATYCQNLEFEGCTDFFLPNYNETILIRTHKGLIDSLDETGTANPTFKLSNWGFGSVNGAYLWCSSEYSSYNAWYVGASSETTGDKAAQFGVVPARRIVIE